ncbi:PEP-CTERM sorting domain-containing protein [Planctomycetota bacterium]|nr:PEP-CTERM sorting domain-containing protein [Planctomycetota bacterium]
MLRKLTCKCALLSCAAALTVSALHAGQLKQYDIATPFPQTRVYVTNDSNITVLGNNSENAYYWTPDSSYTYLDHLPGGSDSTSALAASSDNSVIVGSSDTANGIEAYVWTPDQGMQNLGILSGSNHYSGAEDVSADGKIVTGWSDTPNGYEAFYWTQQQGMVGLGQYSHNGSPTQSEAYFISDDGSTITGALHTSTNILTFRWTQDTGIVALDRPTNTDVMIVPDAINADGSVIVGHADSGFFRWTSTGNIDIIPELQAEGVYITDISADGSKFVGYHTVNGKSKGFIWSESLGYKTIEDFMIHAGLTDQVQGWDLLEVNAISDDGVWSSGQGLNPNGEFVTWVARNPEPSTSMLLLGMAGLGILRRKN